MEELESEFRGAIEDYFESCKEMGIEPRRSYAQALNIRIPSDIHYRIAMMAENSGTNATAFIKDLLYKRLQATNVLSVIDRRLGYGSLSTLN